jgi:sugar porter (SP) family MFS transporter
MSEDTEAKAGGHQTAVTNLGEGFEAGVMLRDVTPHREKWWWNYGYLLKLNLLLSGAVLVNCTNGFDGSLLNGLQSLPQWANYFNNPTGYVLGTMTNGTTFGSILALPIVSWICDRFGRRLPILGGSFVIIFGAIIQGAAQNYAMFVAGRFLIGFGFVNIQVAAPLLLSELGHPSQRAVITSIIEPSFPLGAMIAAWITYGTFNMKSTWSWRIPSLLQCAASFFQIGTIIFCPESPRWLVNNGREEEARQILVEYHAGGDENSQLVEFELAEITATIEGEKFQNTAGWLDFFRTKGNLQRLLILVFIPIIGQLSGNQIISYYLHIILTNIGITNAKTQLVINATLQIEQFVVAVFIGSVCELVGRRKLFISGILGMLTCMIIMTALSVEATKNGFKDGGLARGALAFIYIYEVFYHFPGPILPTYVVEIAPYAMRSKAAMIYQAGGVAASIFGGYTNPIAMERIGSYYYIVYIGVLCAELCAVYFFFPETKGYGLEEIATLFDGENAVLSYNVRLAEKEATSHLE